MNTELQARQPKKTAIVVLGKNIGVGSSGKDIRSIEDHLSLDSHINALAAGMLWQNIEDKNNVDIIFQQVTQHVNHGIKWAEN